MEVGLAFISGLVIGSAVFAILWIKAENSANFWRSRYLKSAGHFNA